MSFLSIVALAVGLLVAAPLAAHLLRRRRAAEKPFPAASLLSTTPPTARRRSALEDRTLFGVRVLAILALALLGATPFISCSHLTLLRKDGASCAMVLVVDDSLSMHAEVPGTGITRFERAKRAAEDLLGSAAPGDSVGIVLAGSPARVALANTTDLDGALRALSEVTASDRATDLEGALAIAEDLVRGAPQPDKRVVLLSDLADDSPTGTALDVGGDTSLWTPIPEIEAKGEPDCAIIGAERRGGRVEVNLACSPGSTADGRVVSLRSGDRPLNVETIAGGAMTTSLPLAEDATSDVFVEMSAGDAIREDDFAPIAMERGELSIAVVADAAGSKVDTGGPPPVEQALSALGLGSTTKPLPSVPDHAEELAAHAGLILDDPPGLTPEERRAVSTWLESGGTALLALGRRAASAPLGAGFEGIVPGVVRWGSSAASGADASTCASFGSSADGLRELSPKGRAALEDAATDGAEILCRFSDGAPLLFKRSVGRGSVLVVTLPFGLEDSDFALRPGFLTLLDRFAELARSRGGATRLEAGQAFGVVGHRKIEAVLAPFVGGKPEPMPVTMQDAHARIVAPRIGRYVLKLDENTEERVAFAPEREIDLRPRAIAMRARDPSLGGEARKMDVSPYVAMALLGLLVAEIIARSWSQRRTTRDVG